MHFLENILRHEFHSKVEMVGTLTAILEKRYPMTPKTKQMGFMGEEIEESSLHPQGLVSWWMLRPFPALVYTLNRRSRRANTEDCSAKYCHMTATDQGILCMVGERRLDWRSAMFSVYTYAMGVAKAGSMSDRKARRC